MSACKSGRPYRHYRHHTSTSIDRRKLVKANQTSNGEQKGKTASEIPGFYYDSIRQRYYRMLPDGARAGGEDFLPRKSHICDSDTKLPAKHQSQDSCTDNLSSFITKRNLRDDLSNSTMQRMLFDCRIRQLSTTDSSVHNVPVLDCNVFDEPLEYCQFLENTSNGEYLLGAWTARDHYWTRVMCLKVLPNAPLKCQHIQLRPGDSQMYIMDRNIVDFCQAQVDSVITCILCITMPADMSGARVCFQPLSDLCAPLMEPTLLMSSVYNINLSLNKSAYSCSWEPRRKLIGIGLERHEQLRDVVTEKDFRLSSQSKTVLSQTFSADGNSLFMGLRGAPVLCSDLRTSSCSPVASFPQHSCCWLRCTANDDNLLVASSLNGELKVFDKRKRKPLFDLHGLVNSHTKLPFILHENDLVFAVGDDGVTKGWSLRTGNLLCTLAAPRNVDNKLAIPRLAYSSSWGGMYGNAALLQAVKDEIIVYPI